jgi:hypothetical protein
MAMMLHRVFPIADRRLPIAQFPIADCGLLIFVGSPMDFHLAKAF